MNFIIELVNFIDVQRLNLTMLCVKCKVKLNSLKSKQMEKVKNRLINLLNLILWVVIIVPICWNIMTFIKILLTDNLKASNTVSSIEFTIFLIIWEILLVSLWYISLVFLKNKFINFLKK